MVDSNVLEHFEKRAGEYEKYSAWCKDPKLIKLCTEPLIDMVPYVRCLDLGGGTGRLAYEDFKRSGRKWTVLDICSKMGDQVPEGVEFAQGDAEAMPFPDKSYGHITVRSLLQYVDFKRALAECARVITTRGHLVVAQKVLRLPGLENNQWLKDYWPVRNPLIRNQWAVEEQERMIREAGFRVLKTYPYIERRHIPLKDWLSRSDTISHEDQRKLLSLITNAPPEVQQFIQFEIKDGILSYNRLWAVTIARLETVKAGLAPVVVSLIVERRIGTKEFVLLQKRKKRYEEPLEFFGNWELPQGKVERKGNFLSQMARELSDETGLELNGCRSSVSYEQHSAGLGIERLHPICCVRVFGEIEFVALAFIVTASGEPVSVDINREHCWVPVDELPRLLEAEPVYPLTRIRKLNPSKQA